VFPCGPDKKPLVKWREVSTANLDEVEQLWKRHPDALPAIDLGKAGLVVLDGDRHANAPDGVQALRELLKWHRFDAKPAPTVRTPGDGVHVYLRQNGAVLTNSRGDLPAGVDIRGAGGYVIAPGATLPDGRVYQPLPETADLIAAVASGTIPPAPPWLVEIVKPGCPPPNEARQHRHAGTREQAYAQAALRGCAAELAGAPKGERNQRLNAMAFRLATMAARSWLGETDILRELVSASIACGLASDDGLKAIEDTIRSGIKAGLQRPHIDLPKRADDGRTDRPFGGFDVGCNRHQGGDDPPKWNAPDLTMLGTGRRPAPQFPTALLGSYWQEWAIQRAAGASAPVDYAATALLCCAGAMLANVRWPIAGASWTEPPVLWAGLIGSPSSGKSPALDAALTMVRYAEDRMALGFDDEQRRFETAKAAAKAACEAWEADLKAKVKAAESAPEMPISAMPPPDIVRPRIRVADFTTEKLALLAAALPRGLLAVRDEIAGWLGSFDKYGGAGSDRAFAIEMYGGRSYTVDRVKSPEPIRIPHLSVGVLGSIQPDRLAAIFAGPDDGTCVPVPLDMAGRLPRLYAVPDGRG
jgi:hypothetical protein